MDTEQATVDRDDLLQGFQRLGIEAGMGLMVHSSLSSFGHVTGGAITVIGALMQRLTPTGTLLMPSFNHGAPFQAGGSGVFDPQSTPTSNGAIPDVFWRLPDVYRSWNPTHPFAAWGRHARRYTEHHHRTLTMGPHSPLGLLQADGGFCLLLGVGYGSNTFHHVVEVSTGAPCLGQRTEAMTVQLPDGRQVQGRTWGWRERSCPLTGAGAYEAEMVRRGYQREGQIGSCPAILFRLQDCYEVAAELLKNGQDGHPPCTQCPIRPQREPHTVDTDWDQRNQKPYLDSEAWTY